MLRKDMHTVTMQSYRNFWNVYLYGNRLSSKDEKIKRDYITIETKKTLIVHMIPAPELPNLTPAILSPIGSDVGFAKAQAHLNKLTPEEISRLDLRIAGKLIRDQAISLSHKVNHELMEPISQWLDDPDWMTRFKVYDGELPNWADYKRRQREWTQQQRDLFRERMKMYWQEIHRKRNLKREVAKMLNSTKQDPQLSQDNNQTPKSEITQKYNYLTPILTPYSPQAEHKRHTFQEFAQALNSSISNLLPWRIMLTSEIQESHNETILLKDFQTYYMEDPRKDIAAKLMHLLQLDSEGAITLSQSEPFGDISVSKNFDLNINTLDTNEIHNIYALQHQCQTASDSYSSIIMIKTRDGESEDVDWQTLSNAQRNKVVADIKQRKILCKAV